MDEPITCPVDGCDDLVDYTDLPDHLYADHDAWELCTAAADLVADRDSAREGRERARRIAVALEQENARLIATAPPPGYVAWLLDRIRYFARAKERAVEQAKAQARRVEQAEREGRAAREVAERWRHVADRKRAAQELLAALDRAGGEA